MAASPSTDDAIARIAFIASDAASILNDYNALAAAFRTRGHQVRCYSTHLVRDIAADLDKQGIFTTQFATKPEGFALRPDNKAIATLASLMKEWAPTTVIAIGGPELTFGLRAARRLNPRPQIIAIAETSLLNNDSGASDAKQKNKSEIPKETRKGLQGTSCLVCLNSNTAKRIRASGAIDNGPEIITTPRCGIDLDTFEERDLPPLGSGFVFHLANRLDEQNGILTYCHAATIVKFESPDTRFLLSGAPGRQDDAISLETLDKFAKAIEYEGTQLPTIDELSACHVFVDLSRGETAPFSAMQAMAIGRPLILANTPANRELVDERVNGCLVDPDDPQEIAQSFRSFLRRLDLVPAMARASRQKAQRKLDQRHAVDTLLSLIDLPDQ